MEKLTDLTKSLGQLEEELEKLREASILISEAKEVSKPIIESSIQLNLSARELINDVEFIIKDIRKIDFPTHLQKVDLTMTAVHTGIQNIQARIEALERNLKDDFNDKFGKLISDIATANSLIKNSDKNIDSLSQQMTDRLSKLDNKISNYFKNLKLLFSVTIFISVVIIILLLFIKH